MTLLENSALMTVSVLLDQHLIAGSQPATAASAVLARMKQRPDAHAIPVRNAAGKPIAVLSPVGHGALDDHALVDCVLEWRSRHMSAFATRFTPSRERTVDYLRYVAIAGADRILFGIAQGQRLVGHIGLAGVTDETADIDNLLLGRPEAGLETMLLAELELLRFAFTVLQANRVMADVLATNRPALALHRLVGLSVTARVPLDRDRRANGDEVLVPARDPARPTSDDHFVRLSIERARFARLHGDWLAATNDPDPKTCEECHD